jgi:hypothetical protein
MFCPQFSHIFLPDSNSQPLLPYAAFTDGHCTDKFEATLRFVVLLQRTVQFATSVLLITAAQTGLC